MKIIISIIICIVPIQLLGQQLTEAVNLAMENNKQVQASELQSQSAEREFLSEERSHLPAISLKANYVHVTDVPQIDIPIPGFNRTIRLNPRDTYETGIQLDYVVFSGFAQSQMAKVKQFEYNTKMVDQNQKEKDIALNTIKAYRNAQFMRLSLSILEKARDRNTLQMTKVKALLNNGMALQVDTLSLALNRMEIEQQIIQSKSVLDNWLQLLATLSGKKINPDEFTDQNTHPAYNEYTLEEQNPFKSIRLQQKKWSAFKAISQSGYYPKVFINASYNYGRPGIDIIKNEWSTYGKWMIGLQWNIWSWRADQASVQSKDLQFRALQLSEQALSDQLKLEYDKAVRSFNALSDQYKVAREAVGVAREKMQIIEVNAQNGQVSASDFNEANLELSQAELKQKQILIQLNLQASKIDYLSGKPVKTWRL